MASQMELGFATSFEQGLGVVDRALDHVEYPRDLLVGVRVVVPVREIAEHLRFVEDVVNASIGEPVQNLSSRLSSSTGWGGGGSGGLVGGLRGICPPGADVHITVI